MKMYLFIIINQVKNIVKEYVKCNDEEEKKKLGDKISLDYGYKYIILIVIQV